MLRQDAIEYLNNELKKCRAENRKLKERLSSLEADIKSAKAEYAVLSRKFENLVESVELICQGDSETIINQ
jgi:chromosome segregation ATPase